MANEKRIDSLYDLQALEKEMEKVKAGLKDVDEFRKSSAQTKEIKVKITGAESVKLFSKEQARLGESLKAVDSLIKQRFATEAKLVTLETDYSKAIAANRLEITKRNQELKRQAEFEAANTGSIEKARARVKQLSDERNKLNLFTKEGQKRLAELNAEIDKNNEFIKKNVDALSKQKINVGNYEGSAKIIVEALEKEKKKLEELEKTRIRVQNAGSQYNPAAQGGQQFNRTQITGFAGGNQGAAGLVKGNQEAVKSLEELDAQIAQSRTVIEGFSRVAENPAFLKLAGGVGDATREFALFQKQLINLERAGLQNTEVYQQIKKNLAELENQISSTKKEIKALSSDTRSFDLFAGSVTFAADAFQTFAGAATLFGASEKDAAEATKTLVAIQSVANGVKGIANELTTKGTAANKLFTASQNLYTFAVGKSTGAMKAFRTALLGLGITAIIFGLYKAAEALGVFGDAAEEAKEKQQALDDEIEGFISRVEKLNQLTEARRKAAKGGIDDQERELKLLKDKGASTEEIYQKELKLAKTKEFSSQVSLANAKQDLEYAQQQGLSAEKLNELKLKVIQKEKEYGDQVTETAGISLKYEKDITDKIKEESKRSEDIRKRNAQAEFEIYKDSAEERARLAELEVQDEKKPLQDRLNALIDWNNEKQQILIAQKDFDLSNTQLTEKERQAIVNKFGIESNKQLEEFQNKRTEIIKNAGERQREAIAQAYEAFKQQSDRFFEKQNTQAGANKNEELLQASKDFANGRIKNEEEYRQRVQEINDKYDKEDIQRELKKQLALVAIAVAFGLSNEDALKRIAELKSQLAEREVKENEDKAKKIIEQEQKLADAKKSLQQEVQNTIIDIINSGFEKELNSLEERKKAIEDAKNKEIDAINQLGLSEEEKQKRIKRAEKDAAFQTEQIEKRKREIQQQRARFEKAQAIANIIQSTAQAIMSALKIQPGGIALAAIVGTIGALQLARAIAQPIPKFERGTQNAPEGLAEVSEVGQELVVPRSGPAYLTPKKRSLIWLSGGERIYDAKKTREILNSGAMQALAAMPIGVPVTQENVNNHMAERMVEELKELNRKSKITIINQAPIETTAWFNKAFKA